MRALEGEVVAVAVDETVPIYAAVVGEADIARVAMEEVVCRRVCQREGNGD